jgi:hypothetical protein
MTEGSDTPINKFEQEKKNSKISSSEKFIFFSILQRPIIYLM